MFSLSLLAALTGYAVLASGLKPPLTRRNIHRSISARDDNHPVSDPNDPFNFQKVGGFYYSTTIHINGQPFEVCNLSVIPSLLLISVSTRSTWTPGLVIYG